MPSNILRGHVGTSCQELSLKQKSDNEQTSSELAKLFWAGDGGREGGGALKKPLQTIYNMLVSRCKCPKMKVQMALIIHKNLQPIL
jgi:hypothetical protein